MSDWPRNNGLKHMELDRLEYMNIQHKSTIVSKLLQLNFIGNYAYKKQNYTDLYPFILKQIYMHEILSEDITQIWHLACSVADTLAPHNLAQSQFPASTCEIICSHQVK